jgi:hypothetical protein
MEPNNSGKKPGRVSNKWDKRRSKMRNRNNSSTTAHVKKEYRQFGIWRRLKSHGLCATKTNQREIKRKTKRRRPCYGTTRQKLLNKKTIKRRGYKMTLYKNKRR